MKPGALLLAPGASATRDHSTLVAVEEAVAPLPVERIDLPGNRAPAVINRIREEAAVLVQRTKIKPAALALGGRSMGGRMCSMAVAEGLPAAALVLISYPLHPPGKHDNLRVDHFGELHVPCLFVSGTKDPFGSPDEFDAHTKAIPGPVTRVWIEGGAHGLNGRDAIVAETVRDWLASIKR
jgi:predicted alpha/beta-hydrolase family hydrolase